MSLSRWYKSNRGIYASIYSKDYYDTAYWCVNYRLVNTYSYILTFMAIKSRSFPFDIFLNVFFYEDLPINFHNGQREYRLTFTLYILCSDFVLPSL